MQGSWTQADILHHPCGPPPPFKPPQQATGTTAAARLPRALQDRIASQRAGFGAATCCWEQAPEKDKRPTVAAPFLGYAEQRLPSTRRLQDSHTHARTHTWHCVDVTTCPLRASPVVVKRVLARPRHQAQVPLCLHQPPPPLLLMGLRAQAAQGTHVLVRDASHSPAARAQHPLATTLSCRHDHFWTHIQASSQWRPLHMLACLRHACARVHLNLIVRKVLVRMHVRTHACKHACTPCPCPVQVLACMHACMRTWSLLVAKCTHAGTHASTHAHLVFVECKALARVVRNRCAAGEVGAVCVACRAHGHS